MQTVAALVACAVLAGLAVFQLRLVLGAPWGRFAWGGQHEGTLPSRLRVGSAVAVVLYAVFAVLVLERAHLLDVLPTSVSRVGIWVLVGYLALGVLLNAISRSKAERMAMTPVAAVLALACVLVAVGP